ncbi:MAG: creatininase family protein, partial [Gammaproteobacteria bacterium]|nr:creatininase family protein [Gammaproteobacteria bacterium]
ARVAGLTGADFARMDRANTVVFVSCSPLEVHGPHLPVVTDNLEAEALCYRSATKLAARHPELEMVHLPPLYVAADVIPHPGSVMFRSSTIVRVLEDLGRSLVRQGFRHIWVASFHGGPRHFVPIEVAADRVNRRYGGRMVSLFSLLLKRLTGGETDLPGLFGPLPGITAQDLHGDSHGGAVETSMMLRLLGEHVGPEWPTLVRRTVSLKLAEQGLPPIEAPDRRPTVASLMRGFKHKLKYYETETYAGRPQIASPEAGEQMLDVLAERTAETLSELWTGRLALADCHSPVWPLRWVFTNRWVSLAFETALRYRNRVF